MLIYECERALPLLSIHTVYVVGNSVCCHEFGCCENKRKVVLLTCLFAPIKVIMSDNNNISSTLLQDEQEKDMTTRKGATSVAIDVEKGNVQDDDDDDEGKLKQVVPCLCFDLGPLQTHVQFIILSLCVFFFYLLYGITMEHIFRLPGLKQEGWYLTLVQFTFYTMMAKADMVRNGETRHIPWKTYFALAAATLTTMGMSNASLGYLNYPTQVVFKCCKLIPVLIGGIIIQRKSYGLLDFYAAALMCVGLIIFTLADSKVSPNFDMTGIAMLSVALVADAVVGNVQEKAMKSYKSCNAEVILYSYGLGFVYLFLGLLVTGGLKSGMEAFGRIPLESYGHAFVFSLTGYLGMQVVLSLVRTFGAFAAVTVTSMRKALSVVISFVLFSKPFTPQYLVGGVVVLAGIYMNLASKSRVDFSLRFKQFRAFCSSWVKPNKKSLLATHV